MIVRHITFYPGITLQYIGLVEEIDIINWECREIEKNVLKLKRTLYPRANMNIQYNITHHMARSEQYHQVRKIQNIITIKKQRRGNKSKEKKRKEERQGLLQWVK